MHDLRLTGSTEIIGLPCYLDVGFGCNLVSSLAAIPGSPTSAGHAPPCTQRNTANRRLRPRRLAEAMLPV